MKILVVDDHPLTVEGYVYSLTQNLKTGQELEFFRASDCKSAYQQLKSALDGQVAFDLALVDYTLPEYAQQHLYNGADLVQLLKTQMPGCKNIILTAHAEVLLIYEIIKNVRPHALAIKNDITPVNLSDMVSQVLQGTYYLSPLVKQAHAEILKKELMFDDNNRLILSYLSKGYRLADLEQYIPLAEVTIRKRISKMKVTFGVPDTPSLIQEAFKQGFV